VLFLPDLTADGILDMLCGACDELALGDPAELATDIGPVIDERALSGLRRHVAGMREYARVRYAWPEERLPGKATSSARTSSRFRTCNCWNRRSSGRCSTWCGTRQAGSIRSWNRSTPAVTALRWACIRASGGRRSASSAGRGSATP